MNSRACVFQLVPLCSGNELAGQGRDELAQIVAATEAVGFPAGTLSIDVSLRVVWIITLARLLKRS